MLRSVGLSAARSISMSNSRAIRSRSGISMPCSLDWASTMAAIRSRAASVILWVANRASSARSAAPASRSSRSVSEEWSTMRSWRAETRSIRPSCSSRLRASRTGVALTFSRAARPRSVMRSPALNRPVAMPSRITR